MVSAHSLAARILANLAIWSILGFGFAFLVAFKDYTMGFNLSILIACKSPFSYLSLDLSLEIEADISYQPSPFINSASKSLLSNGSSPLSSCRSSSLPV